MASIQCSKCGEGIHYHSIPEDIEYTYISKSTWKEICSCKFNKDNKIYGKDGYPKLFRSDTLEFDFESRILAMWKCPACGTYHLFDENGHVKRIFAHTADKTLDGKVEEGLLFNDYRWDELTEKAVPNTELKNERPTLYVKMNDDGMLTSHNPDFTEETEIYNTFIPEWMQ